MDIPSELFSFYEDAVDSLLANQYTSKEAKLYYEKKTFNTQSNFSDSETIEEVLLDTIRVRQYNKENNWSQTGGLQLVNGRCQIIGYSTDKDNIKKCTYLLIEGQKFKLETEPLRHGFGNRYFSAYIVLIK